jgi:hypothetical protein
MSICPVCRKNHNHKTFCSQKCSFSKEGMTYKLKFAKQTNLKKYGVENPFQSEKIKNKIKQTNLEKYGVKHSSQNIFVKAKQNATNLEKYGHKCSMKNKYVQEKSKQTNLKKYGVENPFQSEKIKNKIKQTNLEKYGCENVLSSKKIREKIKQTNLEKYGVEHNFQSEETKEKIKQTNLEKYGVKNPRQSEKIENKIKQTNLKKYGCEWNFQHESIKKQIKQTNLKKYGTNYPQQSNPIKTKILKTKNKKFYNKILNFKTIRPLFSLEDYTNGHENYPWQCIKCNNIFNQSILNGIIPRCLKCYPIFSGFSNIESELQNWLQEHISIECNKRYYEKKYKYELDIYIPSKNIGIEFNGLYWHSEIGGGKIPTYHLNKSEYFLNKGIQIIHIFESEWIQKQEIVKSIILTKLGLIKEKIHARKCEIKQLKYKDCSEFLYHNHIQDEVKSSINLGLFFNEKLVALATFGKPRYNKKYEYELLRYCNKLNTNVMGGFSKLLSYFIKIYSPKSLITYADRRFSNGNVYLKNGFELVDISGPNYKD